MTVNVILLEKLELPIPKHVLINTNRELKIQMTLVGFHQNLEH